MKQLIQSIFPSLFGETAAVSAMFIGAQVTKSRFFEGTIIIKAVDGKPIEWFMSYLQCKGFDVTIIDRMQWKSNTDGSLSIYEK